jgi:signal transduction histidine kinase
MNAVDLLLAAWVAAPALLWGVVAERSWHFLRTRKPRSALFHILPPMAACAAIGYSAVAALALLDDAEDLPSGGLVGGLVAVAGTAGTASMAQLLHLVRVLPFREEPPSTGWLRANYGIALAVALLWISAHTGLAALLGESAGRAAVAPYQLYEIGWVLAALYYTARLARRGGWRPRGFLEVRSPDVLVPLFVIAVSVGAVITATWSGDLPQEGVPWRRSRWLDFARGAGGIALALPFAIRMASEVVPRFLTIAALGAVTAGIVAGGRALHAVADPARGPLIDLVTILALLVALMPGREQLRRAIDGVVLKRRRRREALLQAALDDLSIDLGPVECCERALDAVFRIMQCRGAAILAADRARLVVGDLDAAELERVWSSATASLPRGIGQLEIADLPIPLRDALIAAEVVGVFPIRSPRRDWGHLVLRRGLLDTVIGDAEGAALSGFAAQLGRVLDGADLLARAVAVERSLAHAEKLAAIGELTARVAHEIRNPVAAARSLAQQLASEPDSPFAEEHGLILGELDRVEREVQSLLRFARRDELHLAAIDLRELAAATVGELGQRFESAGIAVDVRGDTGICVRGDRERLRQVLVNLLENACDALVDCRERRIEVDVHHENGSASLAVSDSGPGAEAEVLGRIFEPFFTQKAKGTGLGLAIVKRTIEAHGGRIVAAAAPGSGLSVHIELPPIGSTEAAEAS